MLGFPCSAAVAEVQQAVCSGYGSAQPCPALHSHPAHLAISIVLFIMLNALPCCNEEEFWFSASVVNLVDFGDFLMQ